MPRLSAQKKKVDRFLLFGRNLLEQSSGEAPGGYDSDAFDWRSGANNSLTPNESDEVALEFLHKHAGDLRRAQFHLTTQVSGGAGERHRAILFQAWVRGCVAYYSEVGGNTKYQMPGIYCLNFNALLNTWIHEENVLEDCPPSLRVRCGKM